MASIGGAVLGASLHKGPSHIAPESTEHDEVPAAVAFDDTPVNVHARPFVTLRVAISRKTRLPTRPTCAPLLVGSNNNAEFIIEKVRIEQCISEATGDPKCSADSIDSPTLEVLGPSVEKQHANVVEVSVSGNKEFSVVRTPENPGAQSLPDD
jgi:hypothetical protein